MRPWLLIPLWLLVCPLARADVVTLANGDKLDGEILEWSVDRLVFEHDQLGIIELSLEQLEIDTGTPPTPGLFDTNFMRGWKRTVDIGFNGRQGNTRTKNLTFGSNFEYEDEFKRWLFNARYFFTDSTDADDRDNNGRADLRRDWLAPGSPWFWSANTRYQYDQFESWNERTVSGVGIGYQVGVPEGHLLDLRLQPTFTHEFGDRDTSKGELMYGVEYRWSPGERYSLTFSNQLFSEHTPDPGEWRNLTLAEFRIALALRPAVSLRLGTENEWETNVEKEDKRNDLRYYMTLGLDF